MRKEIENPVDLMEFKLKKHAKKGDMWKTKPIEFLLAGLKEEVLELEEAIASKTDHANYEAADIANYCWMIAERLKPQS